MTESDLLATVTPRLDGRPFRWTVGTRAVPIRQWLHIDDTRHELMAAKDQVLHNDEAAAVITTPAGRPGAIELLTTVVDQLRQFHTRDFSVTDDAIVDLSSSRRTSLLGDDPLATLARALPEDFCILTCDDDQSWVMTAAAVCFTSRWNLASKIGRNLSEIHEPVPGYQDRVAGAVDHLINRLGPDQVLQRSNWTLLDTAELHLPEPAQQAAASEDVWDLKWLRIERQSLRRLTETGSVVFTIDTRVHHVDELDPADRRKLHEAVTATPHDIAVYKGWPRDSANTRQA